MKKEKRIYSVRIDRDSADGFTEACNKHGIKQGYLLSKLIDSFLKNPKQIFNF